MGGIVLKRLFTSQKLALKCHEVISLVNPDMESDLDVTSIGTEEESSMIIDARWIGDELYLLFANGRMIRARSGAEWTEEQVNIQNPLIEAKQIGNYYFLLDSQNVWHRFSLLGGSIFTFSSPPCLQYSSPQCWLPLNAETVLFGQESRIFSLNSRDELVERSVAPYGTICLMALDYELVALLTADAHLLVFEVDDLRLRCDIRVTFDVLSVSSLQFLTPTLLLACHSSAGRITVLDCDTGDELW